ncbi:lon-related putative ATP-dependent protease [Anaerobranca californiensis DSM 14826]|uniref:endopeptidase La n=1 Tax=Anaerobranca californiensis DSM 14826 TaxID=1120989 RepID=A0A1M6RIC9_9FIRM|nr:ATP-binding protein [Anaerobranca californiensis]SHK32117.1 lon-related putative ATP-dependent protease [Anaerobranca californiensis DSM 14826]
MVEKYRLKAEQLTSLCDIGIFDFETTADLTPLKGIIGQERAVSALTFGLKVKKKGYNIYIAGLSGTGRSSYSYSITEMLAEKMPIPDDWIYVYNFKNPDRPKALNLKAGLGVEFKKDIEDIIENLRNDIPVIFAGTDYEVKKNELLREYQQKSQDIIDELNKKALKHGFVFKETEQGIITIPLFEGRPMKQEEYMNLSSEEIKEIKDRSEQLNIETVEFINNLKNLEEEMKEKFKELDCEVGNNAINYHIKKIMDKYRNNQGIIEYIKELQQDILENLAKFKRKSGEDEGPQIFPFKPPKDEKFFNRYKVNLFINNGELKHAPIINETNPSFYNLLGSVEYKSEMGAYKTDFTQIKPGALHLANGGFLILNIREVLTQPMAWEGLKRALKTQEINIESLSKMLGYIVTTSLKPEPIPLDIKVILIGDSYIYHLLYNLDEDFRKLFKIMADFDIEMNKNEDNVYKMAKFIATHCEKEKLKHFDKSGVGKIIEYSSRLADHQQKLSSRFNQIVEILYEADQWAEIEGSKIVRAKHVMKAIEQKIYRNSKYEEKLNEMFKDGTLLIDVDGEKIGQINGLVVMGTGEYSFGKPSRITVSTYKGKSGIINIEREVKKSGSIHDKGVLILSGFLGSRYAKEELMSLTVSISFEQNYSMIDGDSASSTELYAILSSIAEVPIKQSIAVTGSVNQMGEIQPIGGVNEKIEGFYDVCKLKGLTGEQGVIIPVQNVKNLMLKREVIDAVEKGQFHIYAISHVDQGIEILTGIPVGEKGENGEYPEGTLNYLIVKKLKELNEKGEKEREQ